ncbi:ABC transporter ATP-binding protein [Paracoccus aestuariivivens]|uniref:Dipeptide ABC transporter ATP-binding protein n=1 Tax=Paracoccus aestuariivivens TaxID=1820333 RepID=A0A6L6JBC1_9RHOB|nr:ABC transporter ATP-binding protein [Paracoccus aestuariivivens]MTH78806.1 dipeptide ABC transporter ATP-binding protein [Paracoccus aestuariivivens]
MTMHEPLLSIQNLDIAFGADRTAVVHDLSLRLDRGEILALVGESGSGKSVTVKSVMRLIDQQGGHVTAGRILLTTARQPSVDLALLDERQMRRIRGARIAMIFQDPMTSLNPVLTVGAQLVEAVRQHQPFDDGSAKARAVAMLEKVRMTDPLRRFDQYPHELSGGMRQRVMIAMALICEPDILIADEPTTALDVTVQAEILALIRNLQQQTGMGVLFITHDMGVVAEIADRVAVMRYGRIVEEGPVGRVFDAPAHEYTRKLLDAAPKFRHAATATLNDASAAVPPVLSVSHLTTRFPVRSRILRRHVANLHAVEDVSFDLHPRETVAIIGESGCGKSSLAKSLLRLIPTDEGRAVLAGRDLLSLGGQALRAARDDIQMIFQDPYAALDPRMSIRQILSEPLRIRGLAVEEEGLSALVERVGLPEDSLDRYPHQFSGGQRQRICIARALILRPKVLIADEPVSALDVAIQAQILTLLEELKRDEDLALLFISHDMAVVERVADRILVMYRGTIVEQGPALSVLSCPAHPYTRRLLEAVPVSHPAERFERASLSVPTAAPIYPVGTNIEPARWQTIGPEHRLRVEV